VCWHTIKLKIWLPLVSSSVTREVLCYFRKHNLYSTRNSDLHDYNTRRKDDYHVPNCNRSTFKKSFMHMGIKSYNRLPLELRESKGFNDFKHKLKLFLLDHPFYSLQEFFLEGQW
jgi:hypothetical protein